MVITPQPSAHPDPPSDFDQRQLPTISITEPLYRFHANQYQAIYFSTKGNGRFDGRNQGYGICYTGIDVYVAFIETFGRTLGNKAVASADLRSRTLSKITANRPLILVNITGRNLVKIGADSRLSSGDYETSRTWAKAIFNHPSQPDGIYYRSRHDDQRFCCGLFDRVKDHLTEIGQGNLIDNHPELLADILNHYDYGLI